MDGILIAAGGVGLGLLGWVGTALYSRLVGLLDDTARQLGEVAKITAAHGARLDALERV